MYRIATVVRPDVNPAWRVTSPGGIVHVYVNGTPVLENGEFIGGRAGEVILKER